MADFDFITNKEFRVSLEADYRELKSALDNRAFKSVHVLAGSIIEAILVDYLVAIGYQSRTQKDPLKLSLEKLIEACKDEKILSERASDLSTVIRSYRNLIHPARIIRLKEKVDENTATVAQALVEMIVGEIAEQKKATYGYTAEQIIEKLGRDLSVLPILGDILKEAKEVELEKLLLDLIPQKRFELAAYEDVEEGIYQHANLMEKCFRLALDIVSPHIKKRVAERYVNIIKNASENEILIYGNSFFISRDMRYLTDVDRELVKKHILHRLTDILYQSPKVLEGIGQYLDETNIVAFTDEVVRVITLKGFRISAVKESIIVEYDSMKPEIREKFKNRLGVWSKFYANNSEPKARKIEELKNSLFSDDEIPF